MQGSFSLNNLCNYTFMDLIYDIYYSHCYLQQSKLLSKTTAYRKSHGTNKDSTEINTSNNYSCMKQARQFEDNEYFNRMKEGCDRLKNVIFQRSETALDVVSILFGYFIGSTGLEAQHNLAKHFRDAFGEMKRRVSQRLLREVDAVVIVYDIIEQQKAIERGVTQNRIEDLHGIFMSNMKQMTTDRDFMLQRWKLQQQEFQLQINRRRMLFQAQQQLIEMADIEIKLKQEEQRRRAEERARTREEQLNRTKRLKQEREQFVDAEIDRFESEIRQLDLQLEKALKQKLDREQFIKTQKKRIESEMNQLQAQWSSAMKMKQKSEEIRHENDLEGNKVRMQEQRQTVCFGCNGVSAPEQLVYLSCDHCFHSDCLKSHVNCLVELNRTDIICPARDCNYKLVNYQIQRYIDPTLSEKYEESLMFQMVANNLDRMAWCPGNHCRSIFEYEPGRRTYNCDRCNKVYCLNCGLEHLNMTCAENEVIEGLAPLRLDFRQPKFKRCLHCNEWIEKARGLSRVRCRCGYQFCFKCLRQDCRDLCCSQERQIVIDLN